MTLRFLTILIYGHTAVATSIMRLRLTTQIQKLKSLKYKPLEYKATFCSFVSDKLGLFTVN